MSKSNLLTPNPITAPGTGGKPVTTTPNRTTPWPVLPGMAPPPPYGEHGSEHPVTGPAPALPPGGTVAVVDQAAGTKR
jgi:hypothetical protein